MDITKCSGQECPIKEKCVRFTSHSNEYRQSYFTEIPGHWQEDVLNKKVWECEMFWGEQNEIILNQLKEIMK
jgi:hypothetical protein